MQLFRRNRFTASTRRIASGLLLATAVVLTGVNGCDSGPSAAEYLAQAKAYRDKGDTKASVIELKNALRQDPDLAEARELLGEVYVDLGDGAAALKEINRARRLGVDTPALGLASVRAHLLTGDYHEALVAVSELPSSTDPVAIQVLIGQAHLGLGDSDSARSAFQKAVARDAEAPEAHLGLARLALGDGQVDEALTQIAGVLKQQPDHLEALLLRGEAQLIGNHAEKALETFRAALAHSQGTQALVARLGIARAQYALHHLEEASAELDQVLKGAPQHPMANYLRAAIYFQNGAFEEARNALQEVLKILPNHPKSLLLMGIVQYNLGQIEQAEDLLGRFLKTNPGHFPARKLLASVKLKRKQPKEAIQVLAPAKDLAEKDAQALSLLGNAYLQLGNAEKATHYLELADKAEPDPLIRTQLAVSHLAAGDTKAAISELESAVELGEGAGQAEALLIMTRLGEKRFDEALKLAEGLIASQPKNPLGYNLRGGAYLGKGELDKARASFKKSLEVKPSFVGAAMNLAYLDLRAKDLDGARQRLQRALELSPHHPQVLVMLSRLARAEGKVSEAITLLEEARKHNPEALVPRLMLGTYYLATGRIDLAERTAGEAERLKPDNPAVENLQGRIYAAQGRYDKAIETYDRVLHAAPGSMQVYTQKAAAQLAAGRLAAARASYQKALDLAGGKNPSLLLALGQLEIADQHYDKAREIAGQLRSVAPKLPAGDYLEGNVLMAKSEYAKAAQAYQKALAKTPSTQLTLVRFRALSLAGRPKAALETLSKWLAAHPEDQRARLTLASTLQETGRLAEAAEAYQKILAKLPNNAIALNNLAWIRSTQGQAEEALSLAERAAQAAPDSFAILDTAGWIKLRAGRVEQGLRLLQKASDKAPDNREVRYHLAVALSESGDRAGAVRALKKALDQDQPFQGRDKAEELLRRLGGKD